MSESKGNTFTVLIRKSVGLPTGSSSCCGATASVTPAKAAGQADAAAGASAPDPTNVAGAPNTAGPAAPASGDSCCGATITVEPTGSCCGAAAPSGAGESKPAAGSCCG